MSEFDAHHILFNRVEWSQRPSALALRLTPDLIPRLDRGVHNALHRACPAVPLIGHVALERVASSFRGGSDIFSSIDRLMLSIEQAGKRPKVHDIDAELCRLAAYSISLQIPFIQDGLVRNYGN